MDTPGTRDIKQELLELSLRCTDEENFVCEDRDNAVFWTQTLNCDYQVSDFIQCLCERIEELESRRFELLDNVTGLWCSYSDAMPAVKEIRCVDCDGTVYGQWVVI